MARLLRSAGSGGEFASLVPCVMRNGRRGGRPVLSVAASALDLANEHLRAKLEAALRKLYGRRSEKLDPSQLLFEFVELGEEAERSSRRNPRRPRRKRTMIPSHLERGAGEAETRFPRTSAESGRSS